jgi:hypothetical protein
MHASQVENGVLTMKKTSLIMALMFTIGGVAHASTTTLNFTGVTFTDSASLLGTVMIDTGTGAATINAIFTDGSFTETFSGLASVSGSSTDTTLSLSAFSPTFASLAVAIPTTTLASYTGGLLEIGGASSVFATGIGNDLITGGSLAAPVPLPAAAWLMLSGLGGLGVMRRKRKAN